MAESNKSSDFANFSLRDGNLTVHPRHESAIDFSIKDLELPESKAAHAELLISDIFRIDLDAEGSLIEEGSKMELTVTAFDKYGKEFDQDQYYLMNFEMEIEMTRKEKANGLLIRQEGGGVDKRKFIAEGIMPGNYIVVAFAYAYQDENSR